MVEMFRKITVLFLALVLILTSVGFNETIVKAASNQDAVGEFGSEEFVAEDLGYVNRLDSLSMTSGGDYGTNAVVGQCKYRMSGFIKHSTISRNSKVEKYGSAAATILVSTYVPWTGAVLLTSLANSAHLILRDNVYYTQTYYRMFVENGSNIKPIAAEKTITRYYADSAKTKFIDVKTKYNYTKNYCPS
jgi:hypothetical protein